MPIDYPTVIVVIILITLGFLMLMFAYAAVAFTDWKNMKMEDKN